MRVDTLKKWGEFLNQCEADQVQLLETTTTLVSFPFVHGVYFTVTRHCMKVEQTVGHVYLNLRISYYKQQPRSNKKQLR